MKHWKESLERFSVYAGYTIIGEIDKKLKTPVVEKGKFILPEEPTCEETRNMLFLSMAKELEILEDDPGLAKRLYTRFVYV